MLGFSQLVLMKGLRIVGVVALIGVIIALLLIWSQPTAVHVEKSIFIRGTVEDIARETESFQSFNAWSPWNKSNPEVHYTIVTFEGFSGTFYSDIKLEPEGDGTKVTWIYDGSNNSLKEKAMWILMKGDLNNQYEEGLQALKDIVERKTSETSAPLDSVHVQ